MAKLDWKKLEQAFRREHAETGITLLDWCRKKKINYNTARTRIKMGKIDHEIDHDISDEEPSNDACSDDEKCAKNSEKNCANSAETDSWFPTFTSFKRFFSAKHPRRKTPWICEVS
ncbi:TPA: hypothetical protein OEH91_001019 [Escherichia coli]|nr:hypothetical protein [Escherichia coli]